LSVGGDIFVFVDFFVGAEAALTDTVDLVGRLGHFRQNQIAQSCGRSHTGNGCAHEELAPVQVNALTGDF
jgi:hypothetical protein